MEAHRQSKRQQPGSRQDACTASQARRSGWTEGTRLVRPVTVDQGRAALKQGDIRNTLEGRSRVRLVRGESSRQSGRAETGIGCAQPWG